MKTKLTFLLALTFLFLFSGSSVVFAGDFQDAFDAYKRQDYKTAYKLWLPFAEQGDADAQYNLGVMCYKGQGVLQDDKEAFKWFRLAAEQGYDRAQHYVGFMYDLGKGGVPQDDKEAIKWYRLAAAQGHVSAQKKIKKKLEEQRMAEEQRLAEEQREERTDGEKVNLWETEENEVEKNLKKLKTENSCPYCDLGKTNLSEANLVDANLEGANLRNANLSGTNLSEANLLGAGLNEANLTGANLTGANLTAADVAGANLTDANLTRANLTGLTGISGWKDDETIRTTWTGVNLSGAKLDDPQSVISRERSVLKKLHGLRKSSLAKQQFAEKKQKGSDVNPKGEKSDRKALLRIFANKATKVLYIGLSGTANIDLKNELFKKYVYPSMGCMDIAFKIVTQQANMDGAAKGIPLIERNILTNATVSEFKKQLELRGQWDDYCVGLRLELFEPEEKEQLAEKQELRKTESVEVPDEQKEFIKIVSSSAEQYKKARNEIKRSLVRKRRVESFRSMFGGAGEKEQDSYQGLNCTDVCVKQAMKELGGSANIFTVTQNCTENVQILAFSGQLHENCRKWRMHLAPTGYVNKKSNFWIGEINSLDTDKDGDASVRIKLKSGIILVNKKDITPDDPIYETFAEMEVGDKVTFSGKFLTHDGLLTKGYFLNTVNPTEKGALTTPTFYFDYTSVKKIR